MLFASAWRVVEKGVAAQIDISATFSKITARPIDHGA
jgi:hypothetical protein